MSPSWAGFSARFGSPRDLFPRKLYFSSKIGKLAFFAAQIFSPYFPCILRRLGTLFTLSSVLCSEQYFFFLIWLVQKLVKGRGNKFLAKKKLYNKKMTAPARLGSARKIPARTHHYYIPLRSMGDICKFKQLFWTVPNSFFHKLMAAQWVLNTFWESILISMQLPIH